MWVRQPGPRSTRLGRFMRGRRLDRNPLRLATDRIETVVLTLLVIAFLAGTPFAAIAAGGWVHGMGQRAQLAQEASRYHVTAVVLSVSQSSQGSGLLWEANARWKVPGGKEATSQVPVPYGTGAGTTIQVWTDRSGDLTTPPLADSQVTGQAELAEASAVIGAASLLMLAGALARRAIDKRRMAAWDTDWAAGPHWTTRA